MISYLHAILLGALQGVAELFPVSSLGHTVLIPAILHWQIDTGSDTYLSFLVLTHLATALVLVVFFWRDWIKIITGVLRSLAPLSSLTAPGLEELFAASNKLYCIEARHKPFETGC